MTDPARQHAARAAKAIAKRDRAYAALRKADAELQSHITAYAQATRVWGFTPSMMRQACVARGLLSGEG